MRRTFKIRVLLIFASISFSVLALEMVLRFTGLVHHGSGRFYTYIEYDPLLGWRLIPDSTARFRSAEIDVKLRFNSAGMRGELPAEDPPAETYRILVIGDSFVEGHGVELADRFSENLEDDLNEELPATDFEVLAMGTSGYSTDQELLHLESQGLKYRPDLVLLMVYYDDIMPNIRPESWGVPKPVFQLHENSLVLKNVPVPRISHTSTEGMEIGRWLNANSDLFFLATHVLRTSPLDDLAIRAGLILPPLEKGTDSWYEQRVFRTGYPEVEEAWKVTTALLSRMKNSVESSGGDLMTFHIPIREKIHESDHVIENEYLLSLEEWDERIYVNRLKKVCDQVEISFIDPEEVFQRLARQGKRLYFKRDLHWNARGHRTAAAVVSEFLFEQWKSPQPYTAQEAR